MASYKPIIKIMLAKSPYVLRSPTSAARCYWCDAPQAEERHAPACVWFELTERLARQYFEEMNRQARARERCQRAAAQAVQRQARNAEIVALRAQGCSLEAIGRACGLTGMSVKRVLLAHEWDLEKAKRQAPRHAEDGYVTS